MKGICSGSLGLTLGLLVGTAAADEYGWQPAAPRSAAPPAVVTLGRPIAVEQAVTLGSPTAGFADGQVTQTAYSPEPSGPPPAVVRAQAPDPLTGSPPPPTPPPGTTPIIPGGPPPGIPAIPAAPNERFNCGVVTEPPPGAGPLFQQGTGHQWFSGGRDFFGNLFRNEGTSARCPFQSDTGFPMLISPVSNPFLAEDPRALTEIRPIFMVQGTPSSNPIFRGGEIEYLGFQARVAFTERLSLVMSELGLIWLEPHNSGGDFGSHVGFSELRIGPKYAFYRCESTGTIASAGLNFDIPIGPHKVFQDTGSLSLEPYLTVGQNLGRNLRFGSFNLLDTLGYSVATDSKRTDYIFNSLHLDFDVANAHIIYPLIEFNYFHYTAAGNAQDLGFEGRDLINFGSAGVSGRDSFSMAVGARYKLNEHFQTGAAFEFPISGHRDLLDYRVNLDLIFRY
jgi:hypothetical protein